MTSELDKGILLNAVFKAVTEAAQGPNAKELIEKIEALAEDQGSLSLTELAEILNSADVEWRKD